VIPTFIKSHEASADIEAFRIARFSDAGASQKVAQGSAATDALIGVFDRMGGATGGMVDVVRAGLASVRLGGTVAAGDPLTSDANGKAVKALAAAGATRRIVGFADQPGVADDIIDAWIAPGLLHEPA
jgi:hypothetical protein